jgi:ketosteroid isomerase-like protein
MSQGNVEIVRRSNAVFNSGDWDVPSTFCVPTSSGSWPGSTRMPERWPDARPSQPTAESGRRRCPICLELDQVLDAGDEVVGVGPVSGTGAGSGADMRVSLAVIFTVRDGQITRAEEYLNRAQAPKSIATRVCTSKRCCQSQQTERLPENFGKPRKMACCGRSAWGVSGSAKIRAATTRSSTPTCTRYLCARWA